MPRLNLAAGAHARLGVGQGRGGQGENIKQALLAILLHVTYECGFRAAFGPQYLDYRSSHSCLDFVYVIRSSGSLGMSVQCTVRCTARCTANFRA